MARSGSVPVVGARPLQYVDDARSVLVVVHRAENAARPDGDRVHTEPAPCHARFV